MNNSRELNFVGTVFNSCGVSTGAYTTEVQNWVEIIRSCKYEQQVAFFRNLKLRGDDERASQIKRSVPAFVCSSACMNGRKEKDKPDSCSNIGQADYDIHNPEWTAGKRELLKDVPWVQGAYETMGGGMRVFFTIPIIPRKYYKLVLNVVLAELDQIVGAKHDPQATNFYRLSSASADPNAWCRTPEEATVFEFTEEMKQQILAAIQRKKESYANEGKTLWVLPSIDYVTERNYSDEKIHECLQKFIERCNYCEGQRNFALLHYGNWARHERFTTADLQQLTYEISAQYPFPEFGIAAIDNRLQWGYSHPNAYRNGRMTREAIKQVLGSHDALPGEDDAYWGEESELNDALEEEADLIRRTCPMFSKTVYDKLPEFLKELLEPAEEDRERDFLLASLTATFSAVMANLLVHYRYKAYSAHIAFCGIAPAGLGKGIALIPRNLLQPIQDELNAEYEEKLSVYQRDYRKWERELRQAEKENRDVRMKEPEEPFQEIFIQPGLCSKSALIDNLAHSRYSMIIYEGEIDVVNESQKSESGKCESVYRLAFMNEPIDQKFVKNKHLIHIPFPKLAGVLTGTVDQFVGFVRSVSNGNLSRLAVLTGPNEIVWKRLHNNYNNKEREERCQRIYATAAQTTREMYHFLIDHPTDVYFTDEQEIRIDDLFAYCMDSINRVHHSELASVVTRGALLLARICATFMGIRKALNRDTTRELYIDDDLFEIAIEMTKVFMRHVSQWSTVLPDSKTERRIMKPVMTSFDEAYRQLSDNFTSKEGVDALIHFGGVGRTKAYNVLKDWVNEGKIWSVDQRHYAKNKPKGV